VAATQAASWRGDYLPPDAVESPPATQNFHKHRNMAVYSSIFLYFAGAIITGFQAYYSQDVSLGKSIILAIFWFLLVFVVPIVYFFPELIED
jgi:hypothetical protein